ncbi:MAG: hypothetical protein Q9171_005552 [Xanthocarpia ochracea]
MSVLGEFGVLVNHTNCSCALCDLAKCRCLIPGRSYPGFWTQWTVGLGEWSDMRMPRPPVDDLHFNFFRAQHTTAYVERYLHEHRYDGLSLYDRIRFLFTVTRITRRENQWEVQGDHGSETFRTSKVIVASGLASKPNMPVFPGLAYFDAPMIHQKDFGQSSVLSDGDLHKVVVLGGGKSSADMVYACVKAGKSVTWIIRKTGGAGPGFLLSPEGKGPYKDAFAIGSTRIAATLTPSILLPDTRWTRFLHGTKYGRSLVGSIWAGADKQTREGANFRGRQNVLDGFELLEPHTPLFWQNGTGGLLHKQDFWDVIGQNVHIHLDDITKVEKKLIHLSGGAKIPTDVILCGTGWSKTSFDFFDPEETLRLGLPHKFEEEKSEDLAEWARYEQAADSKILADFPMLAEAPEHFQKSPETTPYRLYNGIAPLSDTSIAFVGFTSVANYFRGVECQAIWATAYLDGKLALPSLEVQKERVARTVAWSKRRYLSNGELGNFFPFESNFYLDGLLEEVGLKSHLKGWFSYYFVPSKAQDLAGLKDEYITKYGNI